MPTVLLCHCDGTNGSTTFTDVSASNHTMSTFNGCTVSTAQAKFGTGSGIFTAASARLAATGTTGDFDFQSGLFTIECWAYASSVPANICALVAQFTNASNGGWFFGTLATGVIVFWYVNASGTVVQVNSSTTVPTNAWHFYTVDRDAGGTIRVYLDGAVIASASGATFQSNPTLSPTNIGNSNRTTDYWRVGYIDEVRITKDAALYAGAFTPPTAPFANGGTPAQQFATVLA